MAAPGWTFLTNYAHVLLHIWLHPGVTIRSLASSVGITERATHHILTALVSAGYVTRRRKGRCNEYVVHADLPMRHPLSRHRHVRQLLEAVGDPVPTSEAAGRPHRSTRAR